MAATNHTPKQAYLLACVWNSFRRPSRKLEELGDWTFFNLWFRDRQNAYCFQFKKNLRITNIQVTELLCLIHQHATVDKKRPQDIQFHSPAQFKSAFTPVFGRSDLASVARHLRNKKARFDERRGVVVCAKAPKAAQEYNDRLGILLEAYWSLFDVSVVADVRDGSCLIFMPPHFRIKLARVVGESGYIFAAGRLIYNRNAQKGNIKALSHNLARYLGATESLHDKPPFIIHSKEAFASPPRTPRKLHARQDFLTNGIEELKVHLDKTYFDGQSLASLPSRLKRRLSTRLNFPDGVTEISNIGGPISRSIWLFGDRSLESTPSGKLEVGHRRYITVFEQRYLNVNPFHIFDENKPAWVAQTTIPHQLYGAMINITKPWRERQIQNRLTRLADPFCGTATAYFESLCHSSLISHCTDYADILELVLSDNLGFFAGTSMDFNRACTLLELLQRGRTAKEYEFAKHGIGEEKATELQEICARARTALDGWAREHLSTVAHRHLAGLNPESRFLFWVMLRAHLRFGKVAEFGKFSAEEAVGRAAVELLDQIRSYQLWWAKEPLTEQPVELRGTSLCAVQEQYSHAICIKKSVLRVHEKTLHTQSFGKKADASLLHKGQRRFNLVVTDPPYGFNTDEDNDEMARRYSSWIRSLIRSLAKGGHLVMCLPEHSYTGKRIASWANPKLVTSLVLGIAAQERRTIYRLAKSLPDPQSFFAPPFYWRSERALVRLILHFRVS